MGINLTVLGILLQSVRKSRGLTREDVVERLEGAISPSWLSKVERGEAENPSLRHLEMLAGLYRIGLIELLSTVEQKGESATDFLLRFTVPDGAALSLEDIEAARPIMQGVLNAIMKQRREAEKTRCG